MPYRSPEVDEDEEPSWVTRLDACDSGASLDFTTSGSAGNILTVLGVEGYFNFVLGVVGFMRSASTAIGCSLGGVILVELIVLFNIARLRTKIVDENKKKSNEKRTTAEMAYA